MESSCAECGSSFSDAAVAFCGECGVPRRAMETPDVTVESAYQPQPQQSEALAQPVATGQYAYPQPPQQGYHPTQYAPQNQGLAAPPYAGQLQVAPKSPGLALLASFFFPGLGTMLNGEAAKGLLIFFGYTLSWVFILVFVWFLGVGLLGLPFLFGFYIWGLVDAYSGAKKWNLQRGIIS